MGPGVAQVVTRMRLLDRGSGVLAWRLRGALGPLPIDVDFESVYKLNLLTGRVEEHRYGMRNHTSGGERTTASCLSQEEGGNWPCSGWLDVCQVALVGKAVMWCRLSHGSQGT